MTRTGTDPADAPVASALDRAVALYREGAAAAAEALLRPLAARPPVDAAVLRLLGLCQLRLGDAVAALDLLQRARAAAPDDPWTALHLGLGLQAARRHGEAAALFRACQPRLADDPAPWLNLAISLLALGDAAASLRAARRARLRAPGLAQTHYAVGQAHLALGEFFAAEAAFAAATRRDPTLADPWVNLGVARYRLADMQGAKAATHRALLVAPGHRAATANLGAFLRLTGAADAGEALLREALARDPGAAEIRLNLVADLLQEERAEEALALLAMSPPDEPALRRHWFAQRALALLQRGRTAEARATLDAIGPVPDALRPMLAWRAVLLAMAEGDTARAQTEAARMEAALRGAGSGVVPEHRIMAHFDLAKFWSQFGDTDRAFAHWTAGHAALRFFQPFSRDEWRGFVDASIDAFSRVRMHDGPRAGNHDPAPVFIVGMPRSGTTLAEQIIGAHAQVHGAGERGALADTFARLTGGAGQAAAARRGAKCDAATLDAAAARYLADLHALAPHAARIADKMPGNFAYLGLVGLMLPGARIIHCVRDPRDVGLSIFTFRFHGHHPYAHDLADLGWYIREHDRLMAHWRSALPTPLLTLPLTAWVDDFAGTLARVLDFLGLPHDPACARFHERESHVRTVSRAQVRQPVNARGIGRWKPYAEQLAPLIAELGAAPAGDG